MIKVAALLTCFNRRLQTLDCLECLVKQRGKEGFDLTIYLVDDGSSDGTGIAVKGAFPEVQLIPGSGQLYWNGGMRLAWSQALNQGFDFYLWVNDDSVIYPDSLMRMLKSFQAIDKGGMNPGAVSGTMLDPLTKTPTYGGRLSQGFFNPLKFSEVIEPGDEPSRCDVGNGNFTLIPARSVDAIGILSGAYTHQIGDFDYCLRLKKSGFTCWVAPGAYGESPTNSERGGCRDAKLSWTERVEKMQRPNQLPPVKEWQYFVRQHGGMTWPYLWAKTFVRGLFPTLWVLFRSERGNSH